MTRIIAFFLILIFQSCIFDAEKTQEIERFKKLLGGNENKIILDEFIIQMESKITKTYKSKSLSENYEMFLEDILNEETERIIKYTSLDCQLVFNFESTKLANQYQFQKYDTVYFDNGIVTIYKNGDEEAEIGYLDSIEITERIKYLKEKGYGDLIELGKLPFALQNKELLNIEVREYYRTRDKSCLPMFEDYIRTMYFQKVDFKNYVIKANLFYEIYLPNIAYNAPCYK